MPVAVLELDNAPVVAKQVSTTLSVAPKQLEKVVDLKEAPARKQDENVQGSPVTL